MQLPSNSGETSSVTISQRMNSGPQASRDLEEMHQLFRAASEIGKRFRMTALGFEVLAMVVALHGLVDLGVANAWRPLIAFAATVAGLVLRELASSRDRFAERCRQLSVRKFAMGGDVSAARASQLRLQGPSSATQAATKLPAANLNEYYEPTQPPGDARLRELYAHSSFYTWRLLRLSAILHSVVAGALLLVTILALYFLATTTTAVPGKDVVVDAVFTVVLGVLALRIVVEAVGHAKGAAEAHRIADALVAAPLPSEDVLVGLADDYDSERGSTSPAPTSVYRLWRDSLSIEWARRREALAQEQASTGRHAE